MCECQGECEEEGRRWSKILACVCVYVCVCMCVHTSARGGMERDLYKK